MSEHNDHTPIPEVFPGRSKIDSFGQEVRKLVFNAFKAGATIDEVTAVLQEMGYEIERSSVGRTRKAWADIIEEMQEQRWVTEAVLQSLGDGGDSATGRANIQLIKTLARNLIMAGLAKEDENGQKKIPLTSEELLDLARSANQLAQAEAKELETSIKLDELRQKNAKTIENATVQVTFISPDAPELSESPELPDAGDESENDAEDTSEGSHG